MKDRRAEIQYSPCSEKFYVQIFGPSGRKSGDPIDVTSQLLGWWLQELQKRPTGRPTYGEITPEDSRISELQIRLRDLEIKIANRDHQIAELKAAGDGLGSDTSRPGWKDRWARWMRAKGY